MMVAVDYGWLVMVGLVLIGIGLLAWTVSLLWPICHRRSVR